MTRFDHLLAAVGLQRRPRRTTPRAAPAGGSRYNLGRDDRLKADWLPMSGTSDYHIGFGFQSMLERARQLERENDYARRFLSALCNNVLGATGFAFQNKAKRDNGLLDKVANMKIEEAWKKWGRRINCTITGEDSWRDVCHLGLRATARDGGFFWREVEGADNPFGWALEILEIDQLDTCYNAALPNGNTVCLGVEKNEANRVVAYHMFKGHPGHPFIRNNRDRVRVSADKLHLYFIKERMTQSVGVTWFCSAGVRMHHLERYEEAEVIAARGGAEKGGWFQSERGESFQGDGVEIETDADGNKTENALTDFEPGGFGELPAGTTFVPYNPNHPNQAFPAFEAATLRGIAAGLNIDYATLTNDLSQANYSSMRSGKLESQETWKAIQDHMICNFAEEVFTRWLPFAFVSGQINLPMRKLEQFNAPQFTGRRWPWVDPSKDVDAAIKSIEYGLESHANVVAQNGGDLEEIIDDAKEKQAMLQEAGITFGPPTEPQADPEEGEGQEGGDEDDPPEEGEE